ncbi:MAG: cytochrome oxidase maturation protein, cbb3-type [gamma proteobacterium symbiont of Ctena orbiculata]|nr:MAG: cytochrome oxidase maturation protein, cbb3-type [gamma proteobacterium symbiont of Ctena orbiculata]PVV23030.1 MAG: cytochrome oxidase maturation protein, cbb3-type [gamma proteobacterium symbiont of Ctena orbiculata]
MDVIYGLIPGMILLGLAAVGVLFWAARSGQFDDLDGEAHRILMDDDIKSVKQKRKMPKQVMPDAEDQE